ncbi:MAG: SAM-dependent methyltransferase [Acidimicrobiales bacterium]|nr:SAM-dependent methyltransferase [Acidimicrobiales bacterium]
MADGANRNDLRDLIARRIEASGPIGFDEYVAHALYTPGLGFYSGGGGAGRRRDFLTSPEVGPLFGAVVAKAFDGWWIRAGRPDRFVVVEAGAGPGTLARCVLAAAPQCKDALEMILVEPAETQWSTHPVDVTSRRDLPGPAELGGATVVVLANELLDNLPFGLVEFTETGWCEVRVGWADGLVEVLEPLDDGRSAWCRAKAGGSVDIGARMPVLADAASWLGDALSLASSATGGRVVVIDYSSTSPQLGRRPWTEWVRTYSGHGRSGHPLAEPGTCDITVEVAVDQLMSVAEPVSNQTQADFLRAHGIDDLVEEGAAKWREQGIGGGLEAIAGRSRVHEAEALLDPTGLGAFRVLEWEPGPRSARSDL